MTDRAKPEVSDLAGLVADLTKRADHYNRRAEIMSNYADTVDRSDPYAATADADADGEHALAALMHEAAAAITALVAERDFLLTCGIIELAVRNPNVASYVAQWEARAETAEAALAASQGEVAGLRAAICDAIRARYDKVKATVYRAGTPAERMKDGELHGLNTALALAMVEQEDRVRDALSGTTTNQGETQ